MKTFQQMDWINFVLLPMFLFSATFYPITVYPECIQGDPGVPAVARRRAGARDQRGALHARRGRPRGLLPGDDRDRAMLTTGGSGSCS